MKRFLLSVIFISATSIIALCQEVSPLSVQSTERKGQQVVTILANTSAKAVRAIVIVTASKGANGKSTSAVVSQRVFGDAELLMAGKTYAMRGLSMSGTTILDVTVDYVLFSDGTTGGPDTRKQSEAISAYLHSVNE